MTDNPLTPTNPSPNGIDRKIDIGKAIKLRYKNSYTLQQIADVFDCSKVSVFNALKPFEQLMKSEDNLAVFRDNQEQILEGLLLELSANIADPAKLKKASLNNVAYAYDRIFNALRLLQDKSTANIATRSDHEASLQEVEARIAELEGRAVAGQSDEDIIDAEIAALEDESE
jgi:predicted DNA-binding protein YlxM (UPF0122 family)